MTVRTEQLDAHLRMAMVSGLGPVLTRRLLDHFADPMAVVGASIHQLQQVEGIGSHFAHRIRRGLDEVDVDEQWRLIERHGVRLVPFDDDEYPPLLRHIHDPPPLLFVRGRLERTDSLALAIVGSRKCTAYGREQADRLAAGCAQAGLTIVSGGARGIDSAAHRAVLRFGGRTIAVLGCGLAHCYPPENADLFRDIAGDHGAVVSELPMNAAPQAENFPARNRLISGMALGTLVVEAGHRSGALITARLAGEEHNREVMALPGRVDSAASAGCHKIIREGWATLVTNTADILDALGEAGQTLKGALMNREDTGNDAQPDREASLLEATLTEEARALLGAMGDDPVTLDVLCDTTQLPVAAIQSHVTQLQLRGLIERLPANQVRRRR